MTKPKAPKLKPCPFCGGAAQLKECELWGSTGYTVECSKCLCNSDRIFVTTYLFFHGKRNVSITEEKAKQLVIGSWNRRAYNSL